MARIPHWAAGLSALATARLAAPFAWGTNDCASFAADSILAITGADGLAELRGRRRTERAARQQERAIGGLPAAIERAGFVPMPAALAQRGDLVMLAQGKRRVLAICMGEEALAPGERGLERASMRQAVAAWRV
jgi:hypothetical protein